MIRLTPTKPNDGKEYDFIFQDREKRGLDALDLRRWKTLLREYKTGPLIDVACGDSMVCAFAREKDKSSDIVGVDVAEATIQRMREQHSAVRYEHVPSIPWEGYPWFGGFSYAVLGEVLEHVEDPVAMVRFGASLIEKGGVLAVSVPLEEAKEPGACDGEHHVWSFSEEDIRSMLEPYGAVKTKVLRSKWFPKYQYQWPVLVAWVLKN